MRLPDNITLPDLKTQRGPKATEVHAEILIRTVDRSYLEARDLLEVQILERDRPLPRVLATGADLHERVRREAITHRVTYRQAFDAVSSEQASLRASAPPRVVPSPPQRARNAAVLDFAKKHGMLTTPAAAPFTKATEKAPAAPAAVPKPSKFATVTGFAAKIVASIPGTKANTLRRTEAAALANELMRQMLEGKSEASSPLTLLSLVRDAAGKDATTGRDVLRFSEFCSRLKTDAYAATNADIYADRIRPALGKATSPAPEGEAA